MFRNGTRGRAHLDVPATVVVLPSFVRPGCRLICVVAPTPEASDRIKHRYVLRPLAVLPEQSLCGPRLYV